MYKNLCFLLLLVTTFTALNGATIRGIAKDGINGKELPGSTIFIKELKRGVVSFANGSYVMINIPKGSYTISCSFVSYKTVEKKISVHSDEKVTVNFNLTPKTTELSEVIITKQNDRSTDVSARLSEKEASQVINVISAKTIELLPDLNVANVMQRVSGVSMVKNYAGNNTEVIIRGMPPRYNSILINGSAAPSTSGATRTVPLGYYPIQPGRKG